jgi:hypothetical protein
MDEDGATFTNCDITINKGTNTLKLNATDGIKLTNNGVSQFYIDGSGNATFAGNLNAAGGTFSGNLSAAGGTFTGTLQGVDGTFSGTLSGNTITGATISASTFKNVDSTNFETASIENGIFKGTSFKAYEFSEGSFGLYGTKTATLKAGYLLISNNTSFTTINGNAINTGTIACSSINDGTPITSFNKDSFSYPLTSHTHDRIENGNYVIVGTNFRPSNDNSMACGVSGYRWSTVYAGSSTIVTSDRTKKKEIYPMSDIQLEFFMKLIPVTYQFIDGESGRKHYGFISQDVEQAMTDCGLTSLDFAGFIKSPIYSIIEENGDYDTSSNVISWNYFLRYEEFIALNTYVIQQQQIIIHDILSRLSILENK